MLRTVRRLACSSCRVRYACASASGEPRVPIFSVFVPTAAAARTTQQPPRACRRWCLQALRCVGLTSLLGRQ